MSNLQKLKNNRFLHSPIFLGFFALIAVFFAVNVFGLGVKYFNTKSDRNDLVIKKKKLLAEEYALKTKIENLKTSDGVDSVIRDRYNVVKPGEQLAVIVEKPKEKTQEEIEKENRGSFWQRFKNFFKK